MIYGPAIDILAGILLSGSTFDFWACILLSGLVHFFLDLHFAFGPVFCCFADTGFVF